MDKVYTLLKNLKERGQAMVEFAIIMPLFLLCFFCIAYGGLLFTDYLALSNTARSCAHYASTNVETDSKGNRIFTKAVINAAQAKDRLFSKSIYWNPSSNGSNNHYLTISEKELEDNTGYDVKVTINADLKTSQSYLGGLVYNLMTLTSESGNASKDLNDFIHIEYTMFRAK